MKRKSFSIFLLFGLFLAFLTSGRAQPCLSISQVPQNQITQETTKKLPPREAHKVLIGTYPIDQHPDFDLVVDLLKEFVNQRGKSKTNHFYLANVKKELTTDIWGKQKTDELAYAYWVENQAILILLFPSLDFDWTSRKAYFDLKTQVAKTDYMGDLGGCLVTKAWANEAIQECKSGVGISFKKERQ